METFLLFLRVALSLSVVVVLLWMVQKKVTKSGRTGPETDLRVVGKRGLGQKASVVMINADGRRFLLGVTEHSINVLHSSEAPAPAAVPAPVEFPAGVPSPAASPEISPTAPADPAPDFAGVLGAAAASRVGNASLPTRAADASDSTARAAGPDSLPTRAALRRAPASGALHGSILSPATWSQAGAALRKVLGP